LENYRNCAALAFENRQFNSRVNLPYSNQEKACKKQTLKERTMSNMFPLAARFA
jgi:hypothetical protein